MTAITHQIVVSDLPDVIALYDRIEVWRSTTGINGTYSEITNLDNPTSAILDGALTGPFTLNGLSLTIDLDLSTDLTTITFSGTDPLDLQTVINQINAVVPGLASEVPTNTDKLRLTSLTTGTGSEILVTAGAAATALGLSASPVVGLERRPRIISPTTIYKVIDKTGDDSYWYKHRYSNSTSFITGSFSLPQQGGSTNVIDSSQLVQASASLVNGLAQPVVGRRFIFIPTTRYAIPSSQYNVVPGLDARSEVLTDAAGIIVVNLIRGVTYRVAIEGTDYIREFVAPTDGAIISFDLFTYLGTAPDPFDIVQIPPRPIKMS